MHLSKEVLIARTIRLLFGAERGEVMRILAISAIVAAAVGASAFVLYVLTLIWPAL